MRTGSSAPDARRVQRAGCAPDPARRPLTLWAHQPCVQGAMELRAESGANPARWIRRESGALPTPLDFDGRAVDVRGRRHSASFGWRKHSSLPAEQEDDDNDEQD